MGRKASTCRTASSSVCGLLVCSGRTTEKEEMDKEEREKQSKRDPEGLILVRDEEGGLRTKEPKEKIEKQMWGAYKVERKLYFTARALAVAEWAPLEALNAFFEAMLEVSLNEQLAPMCRTEMWIVQVFWETPAPGFVGPTVEDLRRCESAAWRQAFRRTAATGCKLEDALQEVASSSLFHQALMSRREDGKRAAEDTGKGHGKARIHVSCCAA